MNIPTREELASYSVLIGNNTQTVHPVLGTFPVKGCIPMPKTQTGTITTDNSGGDPAGAGTIVLGSGTLFLTGGVNDKVEPGDFLADSNGVIRRVTFVISDTMLKINAKWPSSVSGITVNLVKKNFYRCIMARSTGTAAAKLNEQTFEVNANFINDGAPVSYDITTASSEITFTLSI